MNFFLIVFLLLFNTISLLAQDNKKILFISSYHPSFPTFFQQIDGVKSILKDVQIDIEFMDSKRFSYNKSDDMFLQQLNWKLKSLPKYDAVLTADDNALIFLLKYKKQLFPNTPAVFLGINNVHRALQQDQNPSITGVVETVSIVDTLKLIKKLHPNTEKIIAISDGTSSGLGDLHKYKELSKRFPNKKLEYISLENYQFHSFWKKLAQIDKKTPVLLLSAYLDKEGNRMNFNESLIKIKQHLKSPLYHLWLHGMEKGILGGKLISHYYQGRSAGKIVLDILNGKSISSISVKRDGLNKYFFDYSQLKQFGIEHSKLPKESIILNKPISFYEEHKTLIWSIIVFLAFLFIIILIIQINIIRRRKIEHHFNTLIANLPGVSYRMNNNKDRTAVFLSEKCKELTGYETTDFVEKRLLSFSGITYVDDRAHIWNIVQKALESKQSFELEYRIIMPDGRIKWVWEQGVGIFKNNELLYLDGIILDNDERKKNEFLLVEKENRFRMLFENSEVSIWNEDLSGVVETLEELRKEGVIDIHQHLTQNLTLAEDTAKKVKVIDVNDATLKLFNANSKKEFLLGIHKTFGENAIEVFIDELTAIWNKEESFSKEALFKTLDGNTIEGIVTFQIPKELEQFANISVSIINITRLKKVENELRTVNNRLIQKTENLETMIQEAPNPIILHRKDGTIMMMNHVWEESTGYTLKEIPTIEDWVNIVYTNTQIRDSVKEHIQSLYTITEKTDEGEFSFLNKFGEKITWQFSSAPIEINNQQVIMSSAMDITELKRKDEMLINQSRSAAMGEMIGMIAHQWRQPLSAISMGANNMLLDIELKKLVLSDVEECSRMINKQTQYLSKTIDDFRNFFKPDKVTSDITIRKIMESTLEIVQDSLKNNNIEITTSFETEKTVQAFPRELMQVFVNIINNSKDALLLTKPEKPSIHVHVYEDDNYINTEICDNGGGINITSLQKVFDPYFSTKNEKTGTGLGLYMSKMIIENHLNGSIEAKNTQTGACFTIRLRTVL